MNNDGNNTFIYEDNGEFEFEYTDNKGNTGKIYTSVNWIDKVAPPELFSPGLLLLSGLLSTFGLLSSGFSFGLSIFGLS